MTVNTSEMTNVYLEHVKNNFLSEDWPKNLNECYNLHTKINNLVHKSPEEVNQTNHLELWFPEDDLEIWSPGDGLPKELCKPIAASLDVESLTNLALVNKAWRNQIGLNPICKSTINAAFFINKSKEIRNTCPIEELPRAIRQQIFSKEKELSQLMKEEQSSANKDNFNFINKFLTNLEDLYKLEDLEKYIKLETENFSDTAGKSERLPSPIIDLINLSIPEDRSRLDECLHLMPERTRQHADQLSTYILSPLTEDAIPILNPATASQPTTAASQPAPIFTYQAPFAAELLQLEFDDLWLEDVL